MYSNVSTGSTTKKQRPTTSYLVRPRLGALRSIYSSRPFSAYSSDKKKKLKKSASPKMEFIRRKPDYADTAYREAVGRLRILLAESYTAPAPIKRIYGSRPVRELDSAGEETDNQSLISAGSRHSRVERSYYSYNPITPRKYYYPALRTKLNMVPADSEKPVTETSKFETGTTAPPELMSFIERQEDYIEQLEKESRFCRDELSSLISKVKDVISENETLHDKQKSRLIKSVFNHLETETETETEFENNKSILKSPKKSKKTRIIEGPSIVFESRISELEAQLTQARIDLKKAQEENENFRRKISDGSILDGPGYETFRKQIDTLQREREDLLDKIKTLSNALSKLRDKENETCDQVKRSLDVAEQAQYEKNAADLEIRRLKDELERQHAKLRDAVADQGRRIADERSAVERRYTQQIEQLTAELGVQWETTNKLQLELDKQRRENGDLRREVAQKQSLIDELKKDMQNRIINLQSDIGVSGAEKSALEQQIATLQMANERTERQSKQEIVRLQTEIQSLRQRLDRADADLIHSRRENIRLTEQVASLEKEINLNAALADERSKSATPRAGGEILALPPPTPKKDNREKELSSMIQDMENKHAATVADLEGMIYSQNQLMNKLSTECHILTQKLEDASLRHKEEIRDLQTNLDLLNSRFSQSQMPTPSIKDVDHTPTNLRTAPQQPNIPTTTENKAFHPSNGKSTVSSSSRQSSLEKIQSPVKTPSLQGPTSNQQYPADNNKQKFEPPPQKYQQPQYDDPNQQLYDTNQVYPEGGDQYPYDQQYVNPNTQYNPNQQYDGSAGQYEYDVNSQYDPNQQYQGDPNQQYQGDLNQTYEGDPNQYVDSNDPNNAEQYYPQTEQGFSEEPLKNPPAVDIPKK